MKRSRLNAIVLVLFISTRFAPGCEQRSRASAEHKVVGTWFGKHFDYLNSDKVHAAFEQCPDSRVGKCRLHSLARCAPLGEEIEDDRSVFLLRLAQAPWQKPPRPEIP